MTISCDCHLKIITKHLPCTVEQIWLSYLEVHCKSFSSKDRILIRTMALTNRTNKDPKDWRYEEWWLPLRGSGVGIQLPAVAPAPLPALKGTVAWDGFLTYSVISMELFKDLKQDVFIFQSKVFKALVHSTTQQHVSINFLQRPKAQEKFSHVENLSCSERQKVLNLNFGFADLYYIRIRIQDFQQKIWIRVRARSPSIFISFLAILHRKK